jgi:light-regulated signal transduction histidine kinase (bacteriophytochrome)
MGRLIDDLLGLSRVSRGELRRQQCDLSAMAGDIAAALARAKPERKVEWTIGRGLRAYCDPGLIRAALENLLGNAWKYTEKHPAARIEFGQSRLDSDRVFFVKDDGAGFDMAYASKLFKPFSRLHAAREFEGTGIGLATVHRIVQRHGGRIWAESAPEKGATFYFTLGDS